MRFGFYPQNPLPRLVIDPHPPDFVTEINLKLEDCGWAGGGGGGGGDLSDAPIFKFSAANGDRAASSNFTASAVAPHHLGRRLIQSASGRFPPKIGTRGGRAAMCAGTYALFAFPRRLLFEGVATHVVTGVRSAFRADTSKIYPRRGKGVPGAHGFCAELATPESTRSPLPLPRLQPPYYRRWYGPMDSHIVWAARLRGPPLWHTGCVGKDNPGVSLRISHRIWHVRISCTFSPRILGGGEEMPQITATLQNWPYIWRQRINGHIEVRNFTELYEIRDQIVSDLCNIRLILSVC